MRCPTSPEVLLAWYRAALHDPDHPRQSDEPQCGWYRLRKVKGGPFVAVRIWCRQITNPDTGELLEPESFHASVAGEAAIPADIWTYCSPISREQHESLAAMSAQPEMAATHAAIDLSLTPVGPSLRR